MRKAKILELNELWIQAVKKAYRKKETHFQIGEGVRRVPTVVEFRTDSFQNRAKEISLSFTRRYSETCSHGEGKNEEEFGSMAPSVGKGSHGVIFFFARQLLQTTMLYICK